MQIVNVLELVNHNVFEFFLPLSFDVFVVFENVQSEQDQVVVVEAEAFFLLVQIAVKDNVFRGMGAQILFFELLDVHMDQVEVIFWSFFQFHDFDHVPRFGKCHVAQGEISFFVYHAQHFVDIGVVEHDEVFRIGHSVRFFEQDGVAKAVERRNEAGVVVAG